MEGLTSTSTPMSASRFWNRRIPLAREGDFRQLDLRRFRIAARCLCPALCPPESRAIRRCREVPQRTPHAAARVRSQPPARACPSSSGRACGTIPSRAFTGSRCPVTEAIYCDAGAIVAYGEHVRRFLPQARGVGAEKIFVARQAVDPEGFAAVPLAGGSARHLLFVGQPKEYKGIAELLAAWSGIRKPGAACALSGTVRSSLVSGLRSRRTRGSSPCGSIGSGASSTRRCTADDPSSARMLWAPQRAAS
jgi:glycosyltransferase involved in cell wall biosynthesis